VYIILESIKSLRIQAKSHTPYKFSINHCAKGVVEDTSD